MSHLPPDPYKILGISKDAQVSEVRSAYRKLVLKCHPDKVQDPKLKLEKQDEFQRVQQAYELLSDDREREKYNNQVKLADLRKQFQATQGAAQYYTAEPARPRGRSSPPPFSRNYYPRSWEEDVGHSPRVPDPRTPRKEASYVERPSKREMEREQKERDKERERKRSDAARREQDAAAAKEQRKAERRQRDRQRDKDLKRETEEKRRYAKPMFSDSPDEEPTKSKSDRKKSVAQNYIKEAKSRDSPSSQRQPTHQARHPRAPSPPPPIPSQPPPFNTADDNMHRPSGRPRRGSEGSPWPSWTRVHKVRDDGAEFPNGAGTPKQPKFPKAASTASPGMSDSSPRREAQRHHTIGLMDTFVRTVPFPPMAGYSEDQPRGRQRSRKQSQLREEDMDDVYNERRPRNREREYERFSDRDRDRDHDGKHHRRSSRMADDGRGERYPDSSRIKLETMHSRRAEAPVDPKNYHRPPMTGRGASFNMASVRQSKPYGHGDIRYGEWADVIYA